MQQVTIQVIFCIHKNYKIERSSPTKCDTFNFFQYYFFSLFSIIIFSMLQLPFSSSCSFSNFLQFKLPLSFFFYRFTCMLFSFFLFPQRNPFIMESLASFISQSYIPLQFWYTIYASPFPLHTAIFNYFIKNFVQIETFNILPFVKFISIKAICHLKGQSAGNHSYFPTQNVMLFVAKAKQPFSF